MAKENKNIPQSDASDEQGGLQGKRCLNCGAELVGHYCHNCGQEVMSKTLTVTGFVLAYLDNAFLWDSQFFKTLWTLIRRPGHLTKEYNAGRLISQEHPLKLNMFLLFIFVTLFVFFASGDKMTESVYNLTNDERVFAGAQIQMLVDDAEYAQKMAESSRDTVLLYAPLFLANDYPQIISNLETKEDTQGEGLDKWLAVVPQVFIEDEVIVADDSGYYHFNPEAEVGDNGLALLLMVWDVVADITSRYFPMLLLLTAPFLSFSLRLVQRRSKIPMINHFIFALHYTAFLEFLMICVYVLYLIFTPPMQMLEYVMMSSCVYLAVAYRRVYATNWIKAIVKSLLTSLIYFIILLLILFAILIIACFIIASDMG